MKFALILIALIFAVLYATERTNRIAAESLAEQCLDISGKQQEIIVHYEQWIDRHFRGR